LAWLEQAWWRRASTKMKVIGYVRVSTEAQAHELRAVVIRLAGALNTVLPVPIALEVARPNEIRRYYDNLFIFGGCFFYDTYSSVLATHEKNRFTKKIKIIPLKVEYTS
jgi:hypothetical protein